MQNNRFISSAFISLLIIASLFFLSCEEIEGEGGSSSITGKLLVQEFDVNGVMTAEYYAPDEDVFLIYGNSSAVYDDNFKTSFDGSYEFKYLTRGVYQVFAYSDCDTCQSGTEARIIEIEVTEKNTEYILEDLVVIR